MRGLCTFASRSEGSIVVLVVVGKNDERSRVEEMSSGVRPTSVSQRVIDALRFRHSRAFSPPPLVRHQVSSNPLIPIACLP